MQQQRLQANAYSIFEAKRSTGDYHNMFNAPHFQKWWRAQLLPNVLEKDAIVLERASFHLVPEEQLTRAAMKKADLQAWLTRRHIAWEDHWLKTQLIDCVDAEQYDHKVLFHPIHHPELNPIETIWAIVKDACGKLFRQGTQFQEVRQHLETAFTAITRKHARDFTKKHRRRRMSIGRHTESLILFIKTLSSSSLCLRPRYCAPCSGESHRVPMTPNPARLRL